MYQMEESYLKDTQAVGNLIAGFDGLYGPRNDRRRNRTTNVDHDRIFSQSSSTYQKSLELKLQELTSQAVLHQPESPQLKRRKMSHISIPKKIMERSIRKYI